MSLKYRSDIDGLRTVAVLPVILFHLGVAGFHGGFIGVDIFFVISGYLITGLIAADLAGDRFSIRDFYARRIRRIVPAEAAMLVVTTGLSAWLMLPKDFAFYGQSLASAVLSASNLFFWLKIGYFTASAKDLPLLHTWSLGVEEQYYIVFPAILILLNRLRKGWIVPAVWALGLASFLLALWQVEKAPSAAFYLPFGRWWELMVGSLLALGQFPALHDRRLREGVAWVGAALLIGGFVWIDESLPFPGALAIVPCLGTALLIHANGHGGTSIGHALGSRVPRAIGLISYPLYLWHWPLIVLARYALMRPFTWPEMATILAATFAAAILSWRFVERPLRRARGSGGRLDAIAARPFLAGGVVGAVLLLAGAGIWATKGLPARLPRSERAFAAAQWDMNPRRWACDAHAPARVAQGQVCAIGNPAAPVDFAIVGDSMVDAMFGGLDLAAKDAGRHGLVFVHTGCLVTPGLGAKSDPCRRYGDAAYAYIAAHREIRSVMILHRWTGFVEGKRFGLDDVAIPPMQDDESKAATPAEGRAAIQRSLLRAGAMFKGRDLVLVEGIPEQALSVPQATIMGLRFGGLSQGVSRADYDARTAATRAMLAGLAPQGGYRVIDLGPALCTATLCPAIRDGHSLYIDDAHPTNSAAKQDWRLFTRFFRPPAPIEAGGAVR